MRLWIRKKEKAETWDKYSFLQRYISVSLKTVKKINMLIVADII